MEDEIKATVSDQVTAEVSDNEVKIDEGSADTIVETAREWETPMQALQEAMASITDRIANLEQIYRSRTDTGVQIEAENTEVKIDDVFVKEE